MKAIQKSLVGHLPTFKAMKVFNAACTTETEDELQVVERPPVFTQGLTGKSEHLLIRDDVPVIQIDYGGQITYHGSGQLVVYTVIDFKRRKTSVHHIVSALEDSIISTLSEYGIKAAADLGRPGVYVGGQKIASLGLHIKNGPVYHGLTLNVDMDLGPFTHINPYGHTGMEMVQVADPVHPYPSPVEVAGKLTGYLQRELNSQTMAGDKKGGKVV